MYNRQVDKKYLAMIRKMGQNLKTQEKDWSVYIVRCDDDTLYTGIAKDVKARLSKHNAGKGACYTRARRPVELIYREDRLTRSQALMREARIKTFPRLLKENLASAWIDRSGQKIQNEPAS